MIPRHWRSLPVALAIGLGGCGWSSEGPGARVPVRLAFTTQPTLVESGVPISPSVTVEIRDAFDFRVADATNAVSISIGTIPSGGTLAGTTTVAAVHGVATFTNLVVDGIGPGNALAATSSGLTATTSAPFEMRRTLVAVNAGTSHTCAVTAGGAAYCWGDNSYGQLGDGTTTERDGPVVVSGGLTFATVSAGDDHTCGLTKAGEAYCWGSDRSGQLGIQISTESLTCASFDPCSTKPVAVSAGITFAALSAGVDHTCGVTPAGTAYCWGANDAGQLGDGTSTLRNAPAAVTGGLRFAAVSAGGTHTCGVTTAGAAYCWGDNSQGQLGATATGRQLSPMAVAGGLTFTAVSAGKNQTCGITTAGTAYCWGDNEYGQLGNGTIGGSVSPIPVLGGFTFTTVSVGSFNTCGVTAAGAAYCWGSNLDGQLGNGGAFYDGSQTCGPTADVPFSFPCSPTPLQIPGGLLFGGMGDDGNHVCAVTLAGARWAYCWGDNGFGQLGDGTRTERLVPTRVAQ